PKTKRHGFALHEIIEAPECLQVRVLNDVRGVHASAQPIVEAQVNDLPQKCPMPGKQLVKRSPVTLLALLEQTPGVRGIGQYVIHGVPPTLLTCETDGELTA